MNFSIENLNEKELAELNHRIVERLRLIRQMRTQNHMLKFNIGEKICFDGPGGETIVGVLTRFNKKTVTIISQGTHTQWNVHPCFLKKLHEADAPHLKLVKTE